jgi:hypothetical protein
MLAAEGVPRVARFAAADASSDTFRLAASPITPGSEDSNVAYNCLAGSPPQRYRMY